MRRYLLIAVVGVILAVLPVGYLSLLSWLARRPANLGAVDGRLPLRSSTKQNWVSTFANDEPHAISPLDCGDENPLRCLERLRDMISALPRARVITQSDDYLHVEFRSGLFRFVDDAEFLVSQEDHVINFCSAARSGYSDFGVNRTRMERLRESLSDNPG